MPTGIEWTNETWNPFTGCTKVSLACVSCYAERFAKRLQKNPRLRKKYRNGFRFTFHPEELERPYGWKAPRMIFVNSMSDTFHEEASDEAIHQIWKVMEDNSHHVFQILTKRPHRAVNLLLKGIIYPLPNVWMGVTVEHRKYIHRVLYLQHFDLAGFPVRFVSAEPLLSPLHDTLEPFLGVVNWVIVGGETGRGARETKKEWVIALRDLCKKHNIPFFFKQWGGRNGKGGYLIGGEEVREFPSIVFRNTKISIGGL